MRSKPRAAYALVAAAAFQASSAQALSLYGLTQYKKPNLHYGQLALHPSYQLTEMYDSNIYLAPRDTPTRTAGVRGSWITKNKLALDTVLPWRHLHSLSAGYLAEAQTYATQPELNDTINQDAHLDYIYRGAYGLTFRAGDRYQNTTDQAFSQLVERNHRWSNRVYAAADYEQERGYFAGGVDASHTTDKYLGAEIGRRLNRYTQSAGFNLGYMVHPKTKAYVSYHRGITHYTVGRAPGDQDRNNKSHDFGLGVSGALAPKVGGRIEGGVTFRKYDEPPVGGGGRLTRNVTAAANAVYRPSDLTNMTLALSRRLQESVFASNRFYISHMASLSVNRRLRRKFVLGVNAAFFLDKYPEAAVTGGEARTRRDDIYEAGARIEYEIQSWLSTGLSYRFRERNSTFSDDFDYQDMQTAWNLALKF